MFYSKYYCSVAGYEAEQSVSTNMASVTVCFLEKPGTKLTPVENCLRAVSSKAPKLKYAESTQSSRHFDTKYAIVSSMFT